MENNSFQEFIHDAEERISNFIANFDEKKEISVNDYDRYQRYLLQLWALILQAHSTSTLEDLKLHLNNRKVRWNRTRLQSLIQGFHGDPHLVPSLVGVHIRSALIAKGRMSATHDSKNEPRIYTPWEFHNELLEVYFQIYGRSRTFNEFVFNRLSDKKDITNAMVTIDFTNNADGKFLDIQTTIHETEETKIEETTISISQELQERLLPEGLLTEFFAPVSSSTHSTKANLQQVLKEWYPKLCIIRKESTSNPKSNLEPNLISKLAEHAERAYCHYTSGSTSETDKINDNWELLIKFIHPKEEEESIQLWNRRTRMIAKGVMKALQGICIYKYFADGSITTVAKERKDHYQSAITVGFERGSKAREPVIDALRSTFFDAGFQLLLNYNPTKIPSEEASAKANQNEGIWKKLKDTRLGRLSEEKEHESVVDKIRELYNTLHPLCFSAHEGVKISFTAYIGGQIDLSQFRCLHLLNEEDIQNFNKQQVLFIRSHYSLFLDGRSGLFFDKSSQDTIALVKPLSFIHSQSDQLLNLEENDNVHQDLNQHELFKSLSKTCDYLAVLTIEAGELYIFYGGQLILEYSRRSNFSLQILLSDHHTDDTKKVSSSSEWQFDDVRHLLEQKIFSRLPESLEHYKLISAFAIATAVCRVSETPGHGGLMIFARGSVLDSMKTSLNDLQLSYWRGKALYSCSPDQLVSMLIPDGSCLINLDTFIIENQVYIVPIGSKGLVVTSKDDNKDVGKGTRHRTAQAITNEMIEQQKTQEVEHIWSICISADGGISVYTEGRKKFPHDYEFK